MKLRVVQIVVVAMMLAMAFVAGQHSARSVAAQSRQKREYQIVPAFHNLDQINKLGDDGWEAITLNASNHVLLRRGK